MEVSCLDLIFFAALNDSPDFWRPSSCTVCNPIFVALLMVVADHAFCDSPILILLNSLGVHAQTHAK